MCEFAACTEQAAQPVAAAAPSIEDQVADAVLAVLAAENDVDLKCWLDWTFGDAGGAEIKQRIGRAAIAAVERVTSPAADRPASSPDPQSAS